MEILIQEIVERFYNFLWPFTRISALLLAAPLFSLQAVSIRIRIVLALTLTWVIYPTVEWPAIDPLSSEGLKAIFIQAAIGASAGLILQIINAALVVGGQSITASMGLGMANMIDPNLGNVPVLSQFFVICSTLIFLALGGHLMLIKLVMISFTTMPIGADLDIVEISEQLLRWSIMIFYGALLVALPIIVALLFFNICLGVITRASPALNIFAIGFPAMIIGGLLVTLVALPAIFQRIEMMWMAAFDQVSQLLRVQ
ncbi:MAG: flagellar biosynthetic protein FliR [Pseudomonadales bacterium]|nr:flagellar biosynthetic protein FliR [Pseudomonadales bacterium]MDP4641007.1 flagellar biosynthetic protein FliR [Pseudomonadales bacterium]MDP4765776.1 flagellar biosynthetic protein FliR [Pseudomonadales bacterium]MDP4911576.1 flagellar biosynthetic protein FliR [Pseudomonadales bacterium]MDP5058308.1 flagellar biosynthetic protein FliR [Pseudomonadales bacterium]